MPTEGVSTLTAGELVSRHGGNEPWGFAMLTVDPGENIGWAMWDMWDARSAVKLSPPHTADVCVGKNLDWQSRCDDALGKLASWTAVWSKSCELDKIKAYIEYPAFMEGGGEGSARSGNLMKLAIMTGRIHQLLAEFEIEVRYVPVAAWKGQVSKKIMHARIAKRLGADYCERLSGHTLDAVGIGLYLKGHL